MKKNDKAKRLMRLFITLMLMASLLLGCSSTEAETETAEAKPEVEALAEEPAEVEEVEKEATIEEKNPEETEPAEAETEATEEAPAEVEEEAPAEESTKPQISEEPVEVISLAEYNTVSNYISTLDPEKPAIIIFNPDEGYVINMQEGQYYQLKKSDQILFNSPDGIGYGWDFELFDRCVSTDNYTTFTSDYSKIQPKQEVCLKKKLDSGEIIQITCYFDPPAE